MAATRSNHAPLTDIDEATARAEIRGVITTLQAPGSPGPVSFAYPYGYHGPDEQRYLREAGYASARTTDIYQEEIQPPGERVRVGDTPPGASTASRAWKR